MVEDIKNLSWDKESPSLFYDLYIDKIQLPTSRWSEADGNFSNLFLLK